MSNFLNKSGLGGTTTETLTGKACEPCTAATALIEGARLSELLAQVHGWTLCNGNKAITKTYKFADWAGAADFVSRVAMLADSEGHHPDILLTWGKAQITTSTHKVGGLTENDFILASKIDAMQDGADLE